MKNNKGFVGVLLTLIVVVCMAVFFAMLILLALDWTTGEHGRLTITAVDRNLFGTYTIYARNSDSLSGNESLEVDYCIDAVDQELADQAKSAIGKQNTTLIYPEKRVGFFWFDKCHSAPVKEIVLSE